MKYLGDRNNIENIRDIDDPTDDQYNIPESPLVAQATPVSDSQMTGSPACPSTSSPASQHSASVTDHPGPSLSARSRGSRGRQDNRNASRTGSAEVLDYLIRQNEHPVDVFLASLAPTLKELHPCDLFEAKSELFSIVQRYELKLLRQKFPREDHASTIPSQQCSSVSNPKYTANTSNQLADEGRSTSVINLAESPIVLVENFDNSIVTESQNTYSIQEFYNQFKQ